MATFASWRRIQADRWLAWTGVSFSLGFKLLVPMVISTVFLAGGLGLLVTQQVQMQIHRTYIEHTQDLAAGVEAIFVSYPGDTGRLDEYLVGLKTDDPEVVSARILDVDPFSTVIASSDITEVGRTGIATPAESHAAQGGYIYQAYAGSGVGAPLITVFPVKQDSFAFAAIMLATSSVDEADAIRSVNLTIAVAALIAISVESTLLFSVFYYSIWRRAKRMHRAVAAVARGNLTVRLTEGKERAGRDEMFNLARSVDLMIAGLDERLRGEALVRELGRKVLQGAASPTLVADALAATRTALGLESCIFATVSEEGVLKGWIDYENVEHSGGELPVWMFGLTRVALESRRAIVTDRMGREGRFAEDSGDTPPQAVVVPLPRLTKAGHVIIAMAPLGQTIPGGGLAVIDAVAATVAESLHMHAAEEARAESAVKSKVMAAVSHEMRNPLNAILGFVGLVLSPANTNLTERQRRQLSNVQHSATTMLTLVNNYLDLAKIRSGRFTVQHQTVRLEDLVSDVTSTLQPIVSTKSIEVKTSVAAASSVRLDVMRVRQVLTNLLSNAIKFTPPGGRVFVRVRAQNGACRFVISDTGVGIPRESRNLVFTEFARIDAGEMAAGKGSGLGLALTHGFVEAMGGSIRFYSRRGRGTTFVVVLPLEAASERTSAA